MQAAGYELSNDAVGRTLGVATRAAVLAGERLERRVRDTDVAKKLLHRLECRRNGGLPIGDRETVPDHLERLGKQASTLGYKFETVAPQQVESNPLPANIEHRDQLPNDRGWWGYSFHDVPERVSGETYRLTLPEATVVCYRDAEQGDDFYPAVVTRDGRGLDLREIRFRPKHRDVLRGVPVEIESATWIAERVYLNHSHWLTAHLPKLLLLRERGELDDVILPAQRSDAIDDSLKLLGFDAATFGRSDETRPLRVNRLTLLGTDRFRPDLLRRVPAAMDVPTTPGTRRLYISRANATRRRLLNEDELWPRLEADGYERVFLEDLDFAEQVALMKEAAVVVAPHGAGLTNVLFCPPGTDVVELADLSFPNPNFYALASAMGHRYWIVDGESVGDTHPLEKDLRVDVDEVMRIVERATS
jgi:hypothetical protein